MGLKKEIIYPVFLECCQYADDIFWENIFDDLAYGKTPYGTYINKNFLCCSYKNKEFCYKIERKDPHKLYTDIYNLLKKKMNVCSNKEQIKKRTDFDNAESRIKENRQDWLSIRKKNIKDSLIERYVVDMTNKHSLNIKQARYLLSILFIAIAFKAINTEDIKYSADKIQHIDGIEFLNKEIILKRNIYETDFCIEQPKYKKNMYENWDKYLTNIKKNYRV